MIGIAREEDGLYIFDKGTESNKQGPGCSSFGFGSFLQLGPFKVHSDGKTLYMNDYSWNKVANVLFLESPAGVGFSYSNTTSDYNTTGDKRSAEDAYTFLVNWFERFPQYKNRDLYLTGVSYGGRFVAQLAYTIVAHNQNPNQTFINLKDIAIGNPSLDRRLLLKGNLEYLWTHAMISDKTHAGINKYCDFDNANYSASCEAYISKGKTEVGPVLRDNIYSSACKQDALKPQSPVSGYDECSCNYVEAFVNRKNVQEALHAINTNWTICSKYIGRGKWKDSPDTVLPVLKQLIANKVNIWILSGDIDGIISVTTTRLAVNAMQLAEVTDWRPWLSNQEVGGYVEGYKGLTLVTIRGAGHEFASYQPERSLTVISAFLQNKLPPAV
ncbi:unnamed protein product [Cuscuta europaea]|uniref:Uncharacterized protein n=1 Tax=Cuscuta europaea TaxID=41803 RepID=A0A9P0YWC3_CUSEU|nr:unnamed protein product [Cuscuta europaea]